MQEREFDFRAAVNAVSDVVQNRPRPLREFDQIWMKTGDMVLQSEFVARWANGKKVAFIGDGDAISVCVAYLQRRGIVAYGPQHITVFDFDERICHAVERFADAERLTNLDATLYNCLDAFPQVGAFDSFYTNPPWGASNDGESVKAFMQRGMEATGYRGEGLVVVADDAGLAWTQQVSAGIQSFALTSGFLVERLMPRLHSYHLDDNPDLRSCNILFRALPGNAPSAPTRPITDSARLANFYGRGNAPRVRYVRERARVDYGKAHESEYELELLEDAET